MAGDLLSDEECLWLAKLIARHTGAPLRWEAWAGQCQQGPVQSQGQTAETDHACADSTAKSSSRLPARPGELAQLVCQPARKYEIEPCLGAVGYRRMVICTTRGWQCGCLGALAFWGAFVAGFAYVSIVPGNGLWRILYGLCALALAVPLVPSVVAVVRAGRLRFTLTPGGIRVERLWLVGRREEVHLPAGDLVGISPVPVQAMTYRIDLMTLMGEGLPLETAPDDCTQWLAQVISAYYGVDTVV